VDQTFDLLIVGGGINGAAIAREASLNGWRVMLVERGDLAGETSSRSSGLIHGGLRYLEQYDFRLVAEALAERERLVAAAPQLIRPMRFVMPQVPGLRPRWIVRAGLLLYDLIGGRRTLERSRSLKAGDAAYLAPLQGDPGGFVYSDAQVDDARLVVLNAIDAAANGAEIVTGIAVVRAERVADGWRATLSDGRVVAARALVNAAGPWVGEMLAVAGVASPHRVRLVKGSHIVVPRLYEGSHAYLLQQADRRIVFVLPWEGGTAIGTTDVPVDTAADPAIDAEEIGYLCAAVSAAFARPVFPADVVTSWSGVRALHDDGAGSAQTVSRDYLLAVDAAKGEAAKGDAAAGDAAAGDAGAAPVLSVFGGKITTARHLAEAAVGRLAPLLGLRARRVTRDRRFPGGAIGDPDAYLAQVRARWPFLGEARAARMVRAYGSMLADMLGDIGDEAGMGRALGGGLTEVEARWMRTREWARTPADALERRSKLGLAMTAAERAAFAAWWQDDVASVQPHHVALQ